MDEPEWLNEEPFAGWAVKLAELGFQKLAACLSQPEEDVEREIVGFAHPELNAAASLILSPQIEYESMEFFSVARNGNELHVSLDPYAEYSIQPPSITYLSSASDDPNNAFKLFSERQDAPSATRRTMRMSARPGFTQSESSRPSNIWAPGGNHGRTSPRRCRTSSTNSLSFTTISVPRISPRPAHRHRSTMQLARRNAPICPPEAP